MENTAQGAAEYGTVGRGMLAALRHRNFRLFWVGQCFSLVGTWMQTMAQAWLVLELTRSPLLLGLMGAFQFGPILIFSLFAGVVADRLPKRRLIIFTQSAQMVLALVLGILTLLGVVRYWQVALLAFFTGMVTALDVPARQSFIVELVGKRDLMNAIALNSSVFNGARIVGPALAGLVIGKIGIAACFLINGMSFLAVIAGLILIVPEASRNKSLPAGRDLLGGIKGGIGYIAGTPGVLYPLALMGLISALAMNFNVLVPVYAREVLTRDAQGFGIMMSSVGMGALAGGLLLAYLSRFGPKPAFFYGGATGICLCQVALFSVGDYIPAIFILVMLGWSMVTFSASVNSTIQMRVPDHLRGRVMSVYFLLFAGMIPLGNLFSGAVANLLGPQAAFLLNGCSGLLVVLAVWLKSAKAGK